jgi:hypothetical protein
MLTLFSILIVVGFEFVEDVIDYLVISVEDLGFLLLAHAHADLLQLVSRLAGRYMTVFQLLMRLDAVLVLLSRTV